MLLACRRHFLQLHSLLPHALMANRLPPKRVQLRFFTPVLQARQLHARTIAGSLHESISSAQASQAVGGHIWEQRVFNVFTTGDGLCSPHWRLRGLHGWQAPPTHCQNVSLISFADPPAHIFSKKTCNYGSTCLELVVQRGDSEWQLMLKWITNLNKTM